MATKPLKTLTFEGLDDIYTVPQIDASLSTTGKAADAKATGDSLAEKASASGMVDMAKSLVGGKYTSEKQPYHFRKSPSGGAKDEVIVGGSLGWNQLVPDADSHKSGTVTSSQWTVTGPFSLVSGHKYVLVRFGKYSSDTATARVVSTDGTTIIYNMASPTNGTFQGVVFNCTENRDNYKIQAYAVANEAYDFYLNLIDLTACFGTTIADYIYTLETATAGAGVAWVKRYIDLDTYHEYDAGSIQSVEGLVSHDVVGFNQWDEEWESGSINSSGANYSDATAIRSKNYIPVISGLRYYFISAFPLKIRFYNSEKTFVSPIGWPPSGVLETTIPDNVSYVRIATQSNYGTTYNHDICINLSDPSRNGTYEPYEKHSYPLDSTLTLRGVPKLVTDHIEFDGDRYHADGSVERRYGVVDLGTLNWTYNTDIPRFISSMPTGIKAVGSNAEIANILISGYTVVSLNSLSSSGDKSIALSTGGFVSVKTSAYSDAATFKTAMSGQYLVYELATPTTETATPFQSPMLVGQTEEYVSDSVVPVGHDSRYYEDITGKVNNLPSDFSTLIAPVEKTFTATRNYTVGSYLILNNTLYKVTANIANGGTITPNTNVTATTIMAEIMAL